MQRGVTIKHYQGPSVLAKDLLPFGSLSSGLQILGSETLTVILPPALWFCTWLYLVLLAFKMWLSHTDCFH